MQEPVSVESTAATLTWRVHPARERPGAACAAALVVLALAAAGAHFMQNWAWAVLCLAVLAGALNRFLFPSRFEVGPCGVTASYPLRTLHLPWAEIGRFDYDERGGCLSRRSGITLRNRPAGLPLLFGRESQAAIAGIRRYLHQEGHAPCSG